MGEHATGQTHPLSGCATMTLMHWVLLARYGNCFFLPYLIKGDLCHFSQTVKSKHASFDACLRFSGRVDVFALTESMLGIVITGLAIVGAFITALQWSNLDNRIQAFDAEMRKTKGTIEETKITIKETIEEMEGGYKIQEENISKHEKITSDLVNEYKNILKKEAERDKREREYTESINDLIDRIVKLQEKAIQ